MSIFDDAVASVKRRGFHHLSASDFVREWPEVWAQVGRLVEEQGELSRALRKGNWENARDELADVVIVCSQIAHYLELDLDAAIRRKLAEDEGRGWQHNGDAAQRKGKKLFPTLAEMEDKALSAGSAAALTKIIEKEGVKASANMCATPGCKAQATSFAADGEPVCDFCFPSMEKWGPV